MNAYLDQGFLLFEETAQMLRLSSHLSLPVPFQLSQLLFS